MKRKLDWLLKSQGCEILFEDEEILVLNKQPNLLVLPDQYDKTLPNLYQILGNELGKIFVVHRIDKHTSGVLLFAKTVKAHADLNAQFETRSVEKVYEAIVLGSPEKEGLFGFGFRE